MTGFKDNELEVPGQFVLLIDLLESFRIEVQE